MEKMEDTFKTERKSSRWQLLAGSTFLLCLLLVGTVGTLIYVQLSSTCRESTQRSHTPDIQETVHLIGSDKARLGDETVSFNAEESIAIYISPNGAFNLRDYGKGLSIASIQGSDKCTVLATDTSSEKAQDVGEFMRLGGNRNVTMTSDQWEFRIMPSDIEDTSFINPRAHEYCSGGYRWTSLGQRMPGRPDNEDNMLTGGEERVHNIVERGAPGSDCHCHCHGGHCHCHCGCGCCGCGCCGGGGSPGAPGQDGQPGQG